MKQAVHVVGAVPKPGNQAAKGIFLDGSTIELTMKHLEPSHDPALGVFYTAEDGSRWKPVHNARLTSTGEYAGGPGWFEPLADEDAGGADDD